MKRYGIMLGFAMAVIFGNSLAYAGESSLFPVAHAGSPCKFGTEESPGIGYPLGTRDIEGPKGNEVNQLYRIFAVPSIPASRDVVFAGWLLASFDGSFAFRPAGQATINESLPLYTLMVDVGNDSSRLPVGLWLKKLLMRTHEAPPQAMKGLVASTNVITALSPCFSAPWDGKS